MRMYSPSLIRQLDNGINQSLVFTKKSLAPIIFDPILILFSAGKDSYLFTLWCLLSQDNYRKKKKKKLTILPDIKSITISAACIK